MRMLATYVSDILFAAFGFVLMTCVALCVYCYCVRRKKSKAIKMFNSVQSADQPHQTDTTIAEIARGEEGGNMNSKMMKNKDKAVVF